MPSSISLEYLNSKLPTNTGITSSGGVYIQMLNTDASVKKGNVVSVNSSYTNSIENINSSNINRKIGVYNSTITNIGNYIPIVISGIADVLVEDNTSVSKGDYVILSKTQWGRIKSNGTTNVSDTDLNYYIGIATSSCTSGIDNTITVFLDMNNFNTTNGMTSNGGTYHTYTNASGSTSVGNMCVIGSTTTTNGVTLPIDNVNRSFIGVSNQSGIENGSPIQVVTEGNAIVQVDSSYAIALGDTLKLSSISLGKVVSNGTTSNPTSQVGIALGTVAQGASNATVLMKIKPY